MQGIKQGIELFVSNSTNSIKQQDIRKLNRIIEYMDYENKDTQTQSKNFMEQLLDKKIIDLNTIKSD